MGTRQLLVRLDRTLVRLDEHMARSNEHMARGNELMEEIREDHRRSREEHRRELQQNRAAIHNNTQVLRQLLLQREEDREILERIERSIVTGFASLEHGIAARTRGLMRVLDKLDGEGPRPAGA
jgi:hypothetical protein